MDKEEINEIKKNVLGREETAELLGISTSTLDRYCKEGLFPFKKVKGKVLFLRSEVLRFLFDKDSLPKTIDDKLDLILKTRLSKSKEYREVAERLLRLQRILFLMNLMDKEDKIDERKRVRVRDELNVLLGEEREFELREREGLKEIIDDLKKEVRG